MQISCLKENLERALNIVGRAVASRPTVPVIQNVLLVAEKGNLRLTATNNQIAITTWIGAMIDREGEITVPARLFEEFVRSAKDDRIDIHFDDEENTLNVQSGKASATIPYIDASQFPAIPHVEEALSAKSDPVVLKQAINRVAFSAATEESRPVLTGVEIKTEGDNFFMAAADGFRLAIQKDVLYKAPDKDIKIVIPARTLMELGRLLNNQENVIDLMINTEHSQIMFKLHDNEPIELVSQLIAGEFPNYNNLIPQSYNTKVVFDITKGLRASRTAALFAKDASNIVRMEFKPNDVDVEGKLVISGISEELGYNEEEITADLIEGEPGKIAYNSKYLLEVLNIYDSGPISMETSSPSSPGVFKIPDSDDYIHVVMPMFV